MNGSSRPSRTASTSTWERTVRRTVVSTSTRNFPNRLGRNTQVFLADCLQSVLSQTHVTLEVICVNDGSTDASGGILDQIAKSDPRVTVIHQKNAGASVARNRGLDLAGGDVLACRRRRAGS